MTQVLNRRSRSSTDRSRTRPSEARDDRRRAAMSTSKSQPPTATFGLPINDLGARALDALTAFAEANQRVVGQIIELSSSAAAERLRTIGEIQSAAVEAVRDSMPADTVRESFEQLRQDPMGWYRKQFLTAVDGAQRALKLAETNAHIVAQSAERLQGSAERGSKEIQDAVSAYVSWMREVYAGRN